MLPVRGVKKLPPVKGSIFYVMGKRRRGRELTIQFLYQYDTIEESSFGIDSLEEAVNLFWVAKEGTDSEPASGKDATQAGSVDDDIKDFANSLIRGTSENMNSIDDVINRYSKHWRLSRMSKIDRNILRLATYELVYLRDIPSPVTINEAVELAKRYGTEESGAFVNGILDRIRIALDKSEL